MIVVLLRFFAIAAAAVAFAAISVTIVLFVFSSFLASDVHQHFFCRFSDSCYHHAMSMSAIEQVIPISGWTFANSVVVNLVIKLATTKGCHCYHYQHPLDFPIPVD